MKIQHLFFAVYLVFTLGCEKEPLIPKIVDELEFACPAETSAYFLEGMMDGEQFCYYDGVNDYKIEFSVSAAFRTEGPTITVSPDSIDTANISHARNWANFGFRPETNPPTRPLMGGNFPHLKHWVVVESPIFPIGYSNSEITVQVIKETGELPLQSNIVPDSSGFNIVFRFGDNEDGTSRVQVFEARGGDQTGSYLRITELNIERQLPSNNFFYEVTFEFDCNLYYFGKPEKFYKRMQGEMKIGFTVEL